MKCGFISFLFFAKILCFRTSIFERNFAGFARIPPIGGQRPGAAPPVARATVSERAFSPRLKPKIFLKYIH